ncbi:MAG: hypothetical protein GX935_07825 [Erysipelotrichia bacterium]|jgi:hypothetical protein|nr:hypothetical protein [Erysipelotrichia bacterium]
MATLGHVVKTTKPRYAAIKTPRVDDPYSPGDSAPKAQKSKRKAAAGEPVQKTSLGAFIVEGKIDNGRLFITLQGSSPAVLRTLEAKTLAYNARFDYGFSSAGIESYGTPWPCDKHGEPYTPEKSTGVDHFRMTYRLTAG